MFVVESGKVRVFTERDGRARNLAFYREGDFFGELSILNDSPRAASAEAVTPVRLLALPIDAVRELKARFPEFRRLLEERLAQYRTDTEARLPLDFATEQLPAETRVQDKVDLGPSSPDTDETFAEDGLFRKRRRIRRFPHRPADRRDGLRRRQPRHDLPLLRQGREPRAHPPAGATPASTAPACKAICEGANELGLAARAVKVSPADLAELPLPAIVHWDGNHWVVLVRRGRRPTCASPTPPSGKRRMTRADFEAKWSGYAALFDYTDRFEQTPEARPRHRLALSRSSGPTPACSRRRSRWPHREPAADGHPGLHPGHRGPGVVEHDVDAAQGARDRHGCGDLLFTRRQPGAAIPAPFRRRAGRRRDPRLPHAAAPEPADELLQHPPHRRHPAPARRHLAGARVPRASTASAALTAVASSPRHRADGGLQRHAHPGVPRHGAVVRPA